MVAAVPSQFRSITDKNELGGHGTIGLYVDVVSDCDIVNVMISISPFLARNNVTVTNTHVD